MSVSLTRPPEAASATAQTPPPVAPPPPARRQPATFPEKVWAALGCFRSVHMAIVLLALLAAATLVGVYLPQEGTVDPLQIKRTYGANYRVMKAMGLFNVYTSYWFIYLEVIFFFNLLFGSFQWLKPAFLSATRRTFCGPEHIQASPHRLEYTASQPLETTLTTLRQVLTKSRYRLFEKDIPGGRLFYATKGNVSRLGPVVAHSGILMLLIASVYGAFTGYKAQEMAVPGDTFALNNTDFFQSNVHEAIWQGSVPDWKVRVHDFRIELYPEDKAPAGQSVVQQYYADISVLDEADRELARKTIAVNHPLQVNDVTIYQMSFQPTGKLFLEVDGRRRTLEVNSLFGERPVSFAELPNGRTLMVFPFYVQQDPNVKKNMIAVFLRDDTGFVGAKPGQMPPNLRLNEGESGELFGTRIRFERPEIATGLQIKKAPEVFWMYLAYVVVSIGTVMCIFSQRQLWVAVTPTGIDKYHVQMLYKTKKARLSFMKELKRLHATLCTQWQPVPTEPRKETTHG